MYQYLCIYIYIYIHTHAFVYTYSHMIKVALLLTTCVWAFVMFPGDLWRHPPGLDVAQWPAHSAAEAIL